MPPSLAVYFRQRSHLSLNGVTYPSVALGTEPYRSQPVRKLCETGEKLGYGAESLVGDGHQVCYSDVQEEHTE